jgi:hypothetical protein
VFDKFAGGDDAGEAAGSLSTSISTITSPVFGSMHSLSFDALVMVAELSKRMFL